MLNVWNELGKCSYFKTWFLYKTRFLEHRVIVNVDLDFFIIIIVIYFFLVHYNSII